jgi:hypothetical protein
MASLSNHERNQHLTVLLSISIDPLVVELACRELVESVEGLIQSFLNITGLAQRHSALFLRLDDLDLRILILKLCLCTKLSSYLEKIK